MTAAPCHLATLLKADFFSSLPQPMLADIASRLKPVDYPAGHTLANVGKVGFSVWLVVSGSVRTISLSAPGTQASADISAGQLVDESLLMMGGTYTATFQAATDVHLLELDVAAFNAIAQCFPAAWMQLATERMLSTALSSVVTSVFGTAAPKVMALAASGDAWRRLARGEVLARQSEPAVAWYLVLSGELVALQGPANANQIQGYIRRGELAGDLPLMTGTPHPSDLVATRDTWLMRFDASQFGTLYFDQPSARHGVLRGLLRYLPQAAGAQKQTSALRIAVLPATSSSGIYKNTGAFVDALEQSLARHGPVMVMDTSLCELLHVVHAPESLSDEHVDWIRLSAWLERQCEAGVRVILVGDPHANAWNERIARECDVLLHAADGGKMPAQAAIPLRQNAPATSANPVNAIDATYWRSPQWLCLLHSPETRRPSGTAAWLHSLPVAKHFHVRHGHDGDIQRLSRHITGNAIGMALSGGGGRGAAHAGAYQALVDSGVPVDYFSGTSVGALLACILASGDNAASALQRVQQGLGATANLFGDYTLPVVSVLKGERLRAAVQTTFGNQRLEDNWIPCAVVTTNLTRACRQVFSRGLIAQIAFASCSVPAVFKPVIIDGDLHCDGGLVDNLPAGILKEQGCRYTIASYLGTTLQLTLPGDAFPSPWAILKDRLFHGAKQTAGVPHLVELLIAATTLTSEAALAGIAVQADVFFQPDLSAFPALDFSQSQQLVEAGYRSALAVLADRKSETASVQDGLWAQVANLALPDSEAASQALARWAEKRAQR